MSHVEFSDHHPIMVSLFCNVYSRVTKHFRFESAWMTSNNYFEMVKGLWKDNDGVDVNLRRIEEETKAWKCSTLRQVHMRKKELMARLDRV